MLLWIFVAVRTFLGTIYGELFFSPAVADLEASDSTEEMAPAQP